MERSVGQVLRERAETKAVIGIRIPELSAGHDVALAVI